MKSVTAFFFVLLLASWIASARADEDWDKGREAYFKGDIVGAMAPLKKAADRGNAGAQHLYGYVLTTSGEDQEGLRYVRLSADQGYPEGMLELAGWLERGIGTEARPMEARGVLIRLAETGDRGGVVALAAGYLEPGRLAFTDADRASPEALKWVQKAADEGYIPALRQMIEAYRTGAYGLTPDAVAVKNYQEKLDALLPKQEKKTRRRK